MNPSVHTINTQAAGVIAHPSGRVIELDWPSVRATARLLVRTLVYAWLAFNVIQWAPQPDANGNCACPLCNPFSVGKAAPKVGP